MMRRGVFGRALTHSEARAFYDRFGWLQSWQAFYENPALERLVRQADFADARAVVEFGCGAGQFAERLLARELSGDASYLGLDLSPKMVAKARRRVARFGARAEVRVTDGSLRLPIPDRSRDRFVAAYVFDLLSDENAHLAIEEAHRVLATGGRLCAASLSWGTSRASSALCRVWSAVHDRAPMLVGGCRPVDLRPLFAPDQWQVADCSVVVAFAVPTQVLVAIARAPAG